MSKERELLVRWADIDNADYKILDDTIKFLAQPEQDNIQYLLDQVSRLFAENAMLKAKWGHSDER